MTDQQKIEKLTRAGYVILLDQGTRKWLAENDRMALRQLEDAVIAADPTYPATKERAFKTWNELDACKSR
jgi:hypothetical protein